MRHWHLLLGSLQLIFRNPWIELILFTLYYFQAYERMLTELGVAYGILCVNFVVYYCLGLLARSVDPRWKRHLAECRIRQDLQQGLIDEAQFAEMMSDFNENVNIMFRHVDEPVPNIFPDGDENEDEDKEWVYHVLLQILCILLTVAYLQLLHVVAQQFTAAQ